MKVFDRQLTKEEVLKLDTRQFHFIELDQEDIENILKACGAMWYSDNPLKYHALLKSGKHSNGYINNAMAYQYIPVNEILAAQLAIKLNRVIHRYRKDFGKIDRIVSPFSVAHIAQLIGKNLNIRNIAYFEKNKNGKNFLKRFKIAPGETVLVVDDLITTGTTVKEMCEVLKKLEAKLFPAVGAIVYRTLPGLGNFLIIDNQAIPIVYLVYKKIEVYNPEKCPWCKKGSIAIRPKENWEKLISQE